jgi:hypothetical protein
MPLESLVASGLLFRVQEKTEMKSGSLRVTILKDGSAKTREHRDAIKAEGYRWNWIRGQWGKCEIDDLKKEFGLLLKAGVLTASEEEGGALVVKGGFGKTYLARESIRKVGFVFDREKKVYFMQTPNDKMRRCVKKNNEPYNNPKSLSRLQNMQLSCTNPMTLSV